MLYILIAVAAILICFVWVYNGLIVGRQRVQEALSTINTQLKRRYDLIPNLIETVKGYVKHESATLEAVVKARNSAMQQTQMGPDKSAKENMLSDALKSIFALQESYPDLKANASFQNLQNELSDTEDKIQATRQFYNTIVMSQNARVEMFPSNIVANTFKFQKEAYFELDEGEKAAVKNAPQVKF